MNELSYKNAFKNIGRGNKELAQCIWHTIDTHRAISLLVLSVIFNIILTYCFIRERQYVVNSQHTELLLQEQLDSATMANIRYFK